MKLNDNSKFLALLLVLVLLMVGCSQNQPNEEEVNVQETSEIPTLRIGYIYTNHQTPIMMAAAKGEEFKDQGIYLKEIIEKEKYILMEEDNPVANVELIVTKSGSESMTMMAQGHIDLGLASNTSFISSLDQGNDVKILSPVHTEGIALVVPTESEIENWEDFSRIVQDGDKPFTVGYHSPTSAPLILFQAALSEAGISYSKNPEDVDVNITLMDLKGTGNLIPSMTSGQVQSWVGPSPYPELAVTENVGKIVLDMKHLPPEGQWHDFPCCVVGSTEEVLEKYSYSVEKMMELITYSADYSSQNMDEAAEVTSEFTGVSLEAAKLSALKYTTNPSDEWLANMELTYNTLKETGNISQELGDLSFEEAKNELFDLTYIEKIINQK